MKSKILIGVIPLIIFGAIILVILQQKPNKGIPERKIILEQSYQTLTDEKGEVTVAATPKILEAGKNAQFELKFNTHSVDLDYDLLKISRLSDNKGNIYEPLSWSGGKGGHHIEGTLTFPVLAGKSESVKLIINRIDNNDREFIWKL